MQEFSQLIIFYEHFSCIFCLKSVAFCCYRLLYSSQAEVGVVRSFSFAEVKSNDTPNAPLMGKCTEPKEEPVLTSCFVNPIMVHIISDRGYRFCQASSRKESLALSNQLCTIPFRYYRTYINRQQEIQNTQEFEFQHSVLHSQ